MAGKIIADTLEHSTAGSIATNYVVEGSAKSWANIDGNAATPSARNSLNSSSVSDNGTGDYTSNFTSAFSGADYSASILCYGGTGIGSLYTTANLTTSSFRFFYNYYTGGSWPSFDPDPASYDCHGDLA